MSEFYLSLITSIPHPPFGYPDRAGALNAATEALKSGLYVREDPDLSTPGEDNVLMFQLGAGTVLRVTSHEALLSRAREQQQQQMNMQRAAQGLIVPAPIVPPKPYKLVIQTGSGQLEPLDYDTREAARAAVTDGMVRGWIEHTVQSDKEGYVEDKLFIQTGPDTLFIVLSTKSYDLQRRNAMEAEMARARAANAPKTVLLRG